MNTEYIARLDSYLFSFGLSESVADIATRVSLLFGVLLLAWVAHLIARKIVLRFIHLVLQKTDVTWDDALVQYRVFDWFIHIAPAVVFYLGANVVFPGAPKIVTLFQSIAIAYMVVIVCISLYGLLDAAHSIYQSFEIARDRPIKAYLQVVKIIITLVGIILVVSALLNSSPWGLLSGLGALTAVLMLVFRDSILGFVASIQLVANNMVRPGDWIEMSRYGADGDVIDVSLTTVKVQNWDKTITTIPTYALVSDSFRNWRGMSESGGRRIKRSLTIDMNSVQFCSDELIDRLKRIQILRPYLEDKEKELAEYNKERSVDETVLVNGRRMTNLGCFRAYVEAYLWNNPKIHQEMTLLVRQLQPTEKGLPLEIYAFSNDQVWANFEAIQADIFDHLLASLPEFDLRVFQEPGGGDVQAALRRAV